MFHFRTFETAFASFAGANTAVLPGDRPKPQSSARGRHAQALAYAAQRRRAAQACRLLGDGPDAAYWKAGAPVALARASALRLQGALCPLP